MAADAADASSIIWLIATVGGPILLGLVIAWAILRGRRRPGGPPDIAGPEYRAPPRKSGDGPPEA